MELLFYSCLKDNNLYPERRSKSQELRIIILQKSSHEYIAIFH